MAEPEAAGQPSLVSLFPILKQLRTRAGQLYIDQGLLRHLAELVLTLRDHRA